jgi:threonine 3-dehydrogenase
MRALVKEKACEGIWLKTIDKPKPGHHQVLIKVEKTAICGTDNHIYHWDAWAQKNVPIPLTIGHEFYGKIVEIGSSVTHLFPGQRVSGEGHLVCGQCPFCRTGDGHLCPKTRGIGYHTSGVFADYFVLDASNVILLPDSISDTMAAILDPLGNAVHTALTYDLVGADVLITGAGPIGIMAVAIAKHCGAKKVVITDINDYRLQLALKMGADSALNVAHADLGQTMQDLEIRDGFSVGMEMSGSELGLQTMLNVLQNGAGLAVLGLPTKEVSLNWHQIIFKCLRIQGIYGRQMYSTWYKMLAMLESGLDVSPVITHHFAVKDYQEAFLTMALGQSGKVIIDWTV